MGGRSLLLGRGGRERQGVEVSVFCVVGNGSVSVVHAVRVYVKFQWSGTQLL